MGKIAIGEIEKYSNNSNTNFLKLEDDKDTVKVRFMYNTIDDVQLDVVHEVEVGDKKRYVNCLRSYDEPVDNCPLCKSGSRPQVKLFIPVFNEDVGEVQFWQRGKSFISQLSGLCNRYNPLVGTEVEIERNGKKGDQTTRYQLYPGKSDDTKLEDLPEVPDTINGFVLDKSYDELTSYVESGTFELPQQRTSEIIQRRPVSGRTRPQF